jgi:hypothetical protein
MEQVMMNRTNTILFVCGALVMSIPGLFTHGLRVASLLVLLAGFIVFITAVIRSGGLQPQSALWLLGASNLSFWGCLGMWQMRLHFAAPSKEGGVDVFAGTLSVWLVALLLLGLYELGVFSWGAISNRQRSVALIGLAAVLLQVLISIRAAYQILEGV